MENIFTTFGIASIQLIPIFTLTYLQNEIPFILKIFINIHSKLLSIIAMIVSYCLIFINTLAIEQFIRIIISILLIITLSISINYTYNDYTIDEGYYITIPYFIIYSCIIFIISITDNPFFIIDSYKFSIMFICSFICYILFSMNIFIGINLYNSYLNYIAFVGLVLSTFNIILIINYNKYNRKQMKILINFLLFQLIHIYLYLAHLLSVKFEINTQSESKIFNIFNWCLSKTN